MILCLDIGNTHITGGVFKDSQLLFHFRYATSLIGTADQLGIFLINILATHGLSAKNITSVAAASVVPSVDYTVRHMVATYFKVPFMALQAGIKTGLNIRYKNANEVGADRIANAIAAVNAFPNKNIIIADLGTATTIDAVTKNRDYLGGAIFPGLRISMEALKTQTAKLMAVDIEAPSHYIGRTTKESIQSGLFFGTLGILKELIHGFKEEAFASESAFVVGTGGFSHLYKDSQIFNAIVPDLVLQGIYKAYIQQEAQL